MKEGTGITTIQKIENDLIVEENIQHFSADMQRILKELQENKLFSPKYLRMQKEMVILKTQKLMEQNQTHSLKQIIILILQTLPDFLPAENLMQVIKYISETHETMHSNLNA